MNDIEALTRVIASVAVSTETTPKRSSPKVIGALKGLFEGPEADIIAGWRDACSPETDTNSAVTLAALMVEIGFRAAMIASDGGFPEEQELYTSLLDTITNDA